MKIAHIYVCDVKTNSGDFMIGIAVKKYFAEKVLNINFDECEFTNFNSRLPQHFSPEKVQKLNEFDYILVGGGGLILPDTAPNKISCWQWLIPKKSYSLITKPIHVISIGYNLFYNQTITNQYVMNAAKDESRYKIFKENIEELIKVSESFSLRHNYDIQEMKKIIDPSLHHKLKLEFCPTVWYSQTYIKPKLNFSKEFIAFEIKDDREWRRYYKIGKTRFYNTLVNVVETLLEKNIAVCFLAHDVSRNFYNTLKSRGIDIPLLDNSCGNHDKIFQNYSRINKLICTAGHAQMIGYALGIDIISLITHPKLKAFCDDVNDNNYIVVNEELDFKDTLLKMIGL